jgi:hypothetical protein
MEIVGCNMMSALISTYNTLLTTYSWLHLRSPISLIISSPPRNRVIDNGREDWCTASIMEQFRTCGYCSIAREEKYGFVPDNRMVEQCDSCDLAAGYNTDAYHTIEFRQG